MNTIKKKREQRKMTQIELAGKLGITQGAVSQWEAGATNPSTGMILKLSEVLGCTVDELLRNETNSDKEVHLL